MSLISNFFFSVVRSPYFARALLNFARLSSFLFSTLSDCSNTFSTAKKESSLYLSILTFLFDGNVLPILKTTFLNSLGLYDRLLLLFVPSILSLKFKVSLFPCFMLLIYNHFLE